MKPFFILSLLYVMNCLAASADVSLELKTGKKMETGLKVLRPGTVFFNYVISAGEPKVNNGIVTILIDRTYKPDFPPVQIPKSIHLIRGTGFGGGAVDTRHLIYERYHSQGISNPVLRNRFHTSFGANQRTDEPVELRRSKFLFADPGARSYRSVLLLKYSRGSIDSPTNIPFEMGFSQTQENAKITIIDLKDGVSDSVSLSMTLLPEE